MNVDVAARAAALDRSAPLASSSDAIRGSNIIIVAFVCIDRDFESGLDES